MNFIIIIIIAFIFAPTFVFADGMDAMGEAIFLSVATFIASLFFFFVTLIFFQKTRKYNFKSVILFSFLLFLLIFAINFLLPSIFSRESLTGIRSLDAIFYLVAAGISGFSSPVTHLFSMIFFIASFLIFYILLRITNINAYLLLCAFMTVFIANIFLSGYNFIIAKNYFENCAMNNNTSLRNFCYKNLAVSTKNSDYCNKINDDPAEYRQDDINSRTNCLIDVAFVLEDSSICTEISSKVSESGKLRCYLNMLDKRNKVIDNISFCDNIDYIEIKKRCFKEIKFGIYYGCRIGELDKTVCRKYLPQNKADCLNDRGHYDSDCLFGVAMAQDNPSVCIDINNYVKNDCIERVVDSPDDLSVCGSEGYCYMSVSNKFVDNKKGFCDTAIKNGALDLKFEEDRRKQDPSIMFSPLYSTCNQFYK